MTDITPRTSAPVVVHSIEVTPIEYRGQRVLTLAQIDKVHQRPKNTARRAFNANRHRFTEGEDFFQTTPSELREHIVRSTSEIPRDKSAPIQGRAVTLMTESGYLLLVKSFQDDLSWQLQKQLVKVYFRYRELVAPAPTPEVETLSAQQYDELTRALRPLYGLLNNESVQTAIHDHVRVTLGVRHLKDIPAAKFAQAMLLAKDIRARCEIIGRVGSEFIDEMVRSFIAAEAPCTLVLCRQYKQKFKADVPKYPNWLEIQRQLQAASASPVLALD